MLNTADAMKSINVVDYIKSRLGVVTGGIHNSTDSCCVFNHSANRKMTSLVYWLLTNMHTCMLAFRRTAYWCFCG